MKKIDKHITFTVEQNSQIEMYAKKKKITFTKAVNDLVDKGIPYEENVMKRIEDNIKSANIKSYLIFELLKQLYSDLSFSQITNVKDNEALKTFLRKAKIDD